MTVTRRAVLGTAFGLLVESTLAETAASLSAGPPGAAWAKSADYVARASAEPLTLESATYSEPRTVRPVRDPSAFLRWRIEAVANDASFTSNLYKTGDTVYLDFGRHLTGQLTLNVEGVGINIDSPARLRVTFGEVPGDIAEDLYPSKGTLAAAWLPDEIFNLDPLPCTYTVPRRHAFRYLRIDVLSTSPKFAVRFAGLTVNAVSSGQGNPPPLPSSAPLLAKQIDKAALDTLKDCMQTVFEDGPRRDQRLWIGDMRLQALANYATFRNLNLVRRCLYLLAAFPQEDGLLRACVFEKPVPRSSGDTILDYAWLYAVVLREYADQSDDLATCRELWPCIQRQMEFVSAFTNIDGLFVDPHNLWLFIDWQDKLHRDAALQGVAIFSLKSALALATRLGDKVSQMQFSEMIQKLSAAARSHFYDPQLGLFISGPDQQVSWASQAWLALAGVLPATENVALLKRAIEHKGILAPATPYLYHYVVEALATNGLMDEADEVIASYWGSMVRHGADTFWEVYDPADSLASPYDDVHLNSFCHAWSCTPAYFFRKFGLGRSAAYERT